MTCRKAPELLVVAVGVDHDVFDQIVQFRFALLTPGHH
jgi:acetoin utilization deacetylase AcuC-like enzyme